MSCEISGGTFELTRAPDWSTYIRQLRQGSCLICLGQSRGLVHSNVPPEISHDISQCYFNFIQSCQIWCVYFKNIKRNIHQKFVLVSGLEKNTHQDSFSHLGLTKNLFPLPACLFLLRCLLFTKESSNQKTYFPGVDKI